MARISAAAAEVLLHANRVGGGNGMHGISLHCPTIGRSFGVIDLKAAQHSMVEREEMGNTHNGQKDALVACGLRSKDPKFEVGVCAQEGEIKEALVGSCA